MNYAQQIKSPMWQKKRLEVLEWHNFQCQQCGSKEEELHVHHPVYKRGAMIWQYEKEELECLCAICHKKTHEIDEKIKKNTALLTKEQKCRLIGYTDCLLSFFEAATGPNYIKGYTDALTTEREIIYNLVRLAKL